MPSISIYVNHEQYQMLSKEGNPTAKGKKIIEDWCKAQAQKEVQK